ncbi:hypothetical protein HX018_14000 [Sphingobacterium hotanense]|uniref:VRR-NUC domain-containing protein n=1 Tax=Sphingobacterium hotanense TaxID=649196 RepID=A0ABT7NQF0_9SPHI|nr:hypothetical protein [Sphingobacterium hotanense]
MSNELPTDVDYVLSHVERHVGTARWFVILRDSIRKRIQMFLSRRKASGVVAGIPDMILVHHGRCYGFELKTETGTVSQAQNEVHQVWKEDGTPVYLIRSLEEYIAVIETILGKAERSAA